MVAERLFRRKKFRRERSDCDAMYCLQSEIGPHMRSLHGLGKTSASKRSVGGIMAACWRHRHPRERNLLVLCGKPPLIQGNRGCGRLSKTGSLYAAHLVKSSEGRWFVQTPSASLTAIKLSLSDISLTFRGLSSVLKFGVAQAEKAKRMQVRREGQVAVINNRIS